MDPNYKLANITLYLLDTIELQLVVWLFRLLWIHTNITSVVFCIVVSSVESVINISVVVGYSPEHSSLTCKV